MIQPENCFGFDSLHSQAGTDPAFGERINVQTGEFVAEDQARAPGSVAEVISYKELHETGMDKDMWLRQLWEYAVETEKPMSRLLVGDFLDRGIISVEEYSDYVTGIKADY